MGTMTIDGRKVEFTDEKNVLTVIRKAGINIPTLCYHSEVSTFGACRLCTVEDDRGRTFASCSEEPRDGMVIYTNSGKIKKYRKLIVELLLAAHCRDCTTCVKSGECVLQELAHRLGVHNIRFQNTREQYEIDDSSPSLIRDPNKCILCGDCVRMCDNVQGVNAIDFAYRGTEAIVSPAFNKPIAQTDCVNCGQCRVVCPTGAISIKTNIDVVWDALADKDTIVIAQIAPAVRVAAGEEFGIPKGENVMGKLVGVLHRLGFDEVYDTAYGADLTVMEESKEFMERFNAGENLPLFTSCCPAWVKFCENRYPEFVPHLSSCRSPQQMFGAVVREYYKNPEATREIIFEENGTRWLRTGDLGHVTKEGYFRLTGRLKRILWSIGADKTPSRVYPMEIENVLSRHSAVDKCAVVGRLNGEKGYLVIAYVTLKSKDMGDNVEKELRQLCRQELKENSWPFEYHFVEKLPITGAGKIDFRTLEKWAENSDSF